MIEPLSPIHCDAKTWDEHWTVIRHGETGGQGSTKEVASKDGRYRSAFLKILNKQNDIERRKRVHREISSLETLQERGVPKLLQTNARHWDDIAYKLYAVSEFIVGAPLSDVMGSGESVSVETAISWTRELCRILEHCHFEGVVHRDIKPDNILIRAGGSEDATLNLVDFGMAFVEHDADDFRTDLAQEVGNRFLRLPEFHANSANKTDLRSDVTVAAGILFFLLTGQAPATLSNERQQMPHQRDGIPNIIRGLNLRIDRLNALFDRAFDERIDRRLQSSSELNEALARLSEARDEFNDTEANLAIIREHLSAPSLTNALQTRQQLARIAQQIRDFNQGRVSKSLGDSFTSIAIGLPEPPPGAARIKMGFQLAIDHARSFIPEYDIVMTGTEIVVTATEASCSPLILRISSDAVLTEDNLSQIKQYIVTGVKKLFDAS